MQQQPRRGARQSQGSFCSLCPTRAMGTSCDRIAHDGPAACPRPVVPAPQGAASPLKGCPRLSGPLAGLFFAADVRLLTKVLKGDLRRAQGR